MKKLLLILLLCGCSKTTITRPDGTIAIHTTFLINEKIGSFYYQRDNNSLHFEMGNISSDITEASIKAYNIGLKIGGKNE